EQIRLGLSADVPLVSQQWNAIIAVNYAARKAGITRLHHNVFDAKLLCPELVCAHVATLGPGDAQPDYYPSPSRYTHKVSLDPYRKASAKIFNVFRKFTAKHQKGGLDEVFMDVTDVVNQRIMDEYGADLSKWDRETAELMDWKRDYSHAGYLQPFYGIPDDTFEEQFWAELQILKAAEYCNEIRQTVKDELGYTCSAGIANNRLLAKLGSGMNKPFQQTIILPKYIPDLLHDLKITKIRNLGGKFGKQIRIDYNIEMASELWPVPLRHLQERYGDQAGLELWQWCRGIDHIGIRKIKSKSMTSHKSFIPALNDVEEIQFWISSVCLELEARMHAEFDETERWPRTISLGF
ncbi:MAG: putative N-acetyltransferase eso1, partial [Linnemannia elongata]